MYSGARVEKKEARSVIEICDFPAEEKGRRKRQQVSPNPTQSREKQKD
jgi:hypothetical protein